MFRFKAKHYDIVLKNEFDIFRYQNAIKEFNGKYLR